MIFNVINQFKKHNLMSSTRSIYIYTYICLFIYVFIYRDEFALMKCDTNKLYYSSGQRT